MHVEEMEVHLLKEVHCVFNQHGAFRIILGTYVVTGIVKKTLNEHPL